MKIITGSFMTGLMLLHHENIKNRPTQLRQNYERNVSCTYNVHDIRAGVVCTVPNKCSMFWSTEHFKSSCVVIKQYRCKYGEGGFMNVHQGSIGSMNLTWIVHKI